MKMGLHTFLVAGLSAGTANAAILKMVAGDGSGKATVGEDGANIYVAVETAAVDTLSVSFVNVFFNTSNDLASVDAVVGQLNWTYDRSAFELPASLSLDGGNEYGLVSGDQDDGDSLPLGHATWWIDCLTLIGPDSGATLVTIETGARNPQVFGPAPIYAPFTIAPVGFPQGFPNFLWLGDATGNNTPFEINYIPEPTALACWLSAAGSHFVVAKWRS